MGKYTFRKREREGGRRRERQREREREREIEIERDRERKCGYDSICLFLCVSVPMVPIGRLEMA